MKMLRASIALWLLFITISTQAQNQHALLIGISQYKEVTPLQFADRDAVAFAEFLKTQQVPEDNIKLFLNENATRFNIVDELYNTSQSLKKGDRFYFYFGGHGDLEARIGYENSLLLLYNSFKKSYFQGNEYLQLSELKTWFNDLTKKGVEVVFIADACHSGGLIGGKEGNTKTQKALQESWANITKILSCKADEFSLEGKQWGGGRGIFSYHLVNGLTGRADANKDNKVSLSELNNYLTTNVLREANPNIQTPVILGNNKQFLSKVSKEGLAKLADYEKRNFPIITEVNLKGGEEKATTGLISKLDTTLVSTYKQFSKALKDKRVAVYEDSTNCALVHYQKLIAYKIPDNLLQLMKRNLAVGLLDAPINDMKPLTDAGRSTLDLTPHEYNYNISKLDVCSEILGKEHYAYQHILGKKEILLIMRDLRYRVSKEHMMKLIDGLLKLKESTHSSLPAFTLLGHCYSRLNMLDSAYYYFSKTKLLLPNQSYPFLNIGNAYRISKQTDKALESYQEAIIRDTTNVDAYRMITNLYLSQHIEDKTIEWSEKTLTKIDQGYANANLTTKYSIRYSVLFNLSRIYQKANNQSKVNETIARYSNYVNKENESGEFVTNLWAANSLAHALWSDSNQVINQHLYGLTKQWVEIYLSKNLNDSIILAATHRCLGSLHRFFDNNVAAENHYLKAIQFDIGEWNENPNYIPKTKKLMGFFADMVDVYLELCILSLEKNKPKEALQWLEKSMTKGCKRKDLYQNPYLTGELHNIPEYKALMAKYFPDKK